MGRVEDIFGKNVGAEGIYFDGTSILRIKHKAVLITAPGENLPGAIE